MTGRQMKTMLALEGLLYTCGALALALLLLVATGPFAGRAVSSLIWFFTWHFTVCPVFLFLPAFVLLGIAIPVASCRARPEAFCGGEAAGGVRMYYGNVQNRAKTLPTPAPACYNTPGIRIRRVSLCSGKIRSARLFFIFTGIVRSFSGKCGKTAAVRLCPGRCERGVSRLRLSMVIFRKWK